VNNRLPRSAYSVVIFIQGALRGVMEKNMVWFENHTLIETLVFNLAIVNNSVYALLPVG